MPRPVTAMHRIREVLRLHHASGLSPRQIATSTGLARSTVQRYLTRANERGVGWPLSDNVDDHELEARLLERPGPRIGRPLPVPDWVTIHRELRKPGVTLQLLWMEYKEAHPEGSQYTWFTKQYKAWKLRLDVVLRQEHRAGEKLFVDFAGQTIPITDRKTGDITQAQLFVAVLGASSYTYVEALLSQELAHVVTGHVHALQYFGGAPKLIVPDNLKAGVAQADRYEPLVNRTFADLAAHYSCAVLPARPRKPRDKAKVEAGVQAAERWILARLRNLTFFSIEEANRAIAEQLEALNLKPFDKLSGSRRSLYETVDKPALQPLPARPYEYATWKSAKVHIDYHVEVNYHRYSVPYQLVGRQCDVRVAATTVEVFCGGRRVASHLRGGRRGGFTTDPGHRPEHHRAYAEWSPERIVRWGAQTGPATAELIQQVLRSRSHPEQSFRSCLGLLSLGRRYGADRLEKACTLALAIRSPTYRSVSSILKTNRDRRPVPDPPPQRPPRDHANLRGSTYYH